MKSIYTNYKKNKKIEVIFLFIIIMVFCFRYRIDFNEMDVIPYAKATFNKNWIPNDWYLNLDIVYRYLFNYSIGFFIDIFGISQTIIIGRLLTYLLVAVSIQRLLKIIYDGSNKITSYLVIILFFNFFRMGNGAGEWMVGGLETKVFAYSFSILSLTMFIDKKIKLGFLFAGLSLSFHLLIGIYSLFCLVPTLFYFQYYNKKFYLEIIKALPIFIIFGFIGIYGIIEQLYLSQLSASKLGWDIYVNKRVPHHTLPYHFPIEIWIKMFIFSVINILFIIKSHSQKIKLVSYYAIFSVLISVIGLIIFFISGSNHNMKYYFFRFSDIILPLITLLNVGYFTLKKLKRYSLEKQKIYNIVTALIILIFIVPKTNNLIKNFTLNSVKFKSITSYDHQMEDWVKNNTDKNKTFIIPPNMQFFYINFERSPFVSWKHSPQNKKDIVEWYSRLKLLNKNQDFETSSEVIETYYNNLTEIDFINIKKKYPNTKYLITSSKVNLDFKILSTTNKFILYEI